MVINQGDIFWVDIEIPTRSGPGYRRPVLVIQNNTFNSSRINTVITCLLTSNIQRANSPGNILLGESEANLPKRSTINVAQIFTVDKRELAEKIGSLSRDRMEQVLEGIELTLKPRDVHGL